MKTMYELLVFCFYACFIFMIMKFSHLLSFLIGMEMMVVLLSMLLILTQVYSGFIYFLIVLLTFSVCESVVGLVLFIMFTRTFSKDYLRILSLSVV